ncbi:MAG TPA: hypothetical protein VGP93_10560 [Polyangiaceae bacterium]|nr:hypothetical protein [Polyangiaceae bacterium]
MRRSTRARLLVAGLSGLLLFACREPGADPPVSEGTLEVASAAPGALGALAAGTDAAPPSPARQARRTWHVPSDDEEEDPGQPEETLDGGSFEAGPSAPGQPAAPEMPL